MGYFLTFMAGGFIGIVISALCVMAGKEDERGGNK